MLAMIQTIALHDLVCAHHRCLDAARQQRSAPDRRSARAHCSLVASHDGSNRVLFRYAGSVLDVIYNPTLIEQYPRKVRSLCSSSSVSRFFGHRMFTQDHADCPMADNVQLLAFPSNLRLLEKAEDATLHRFVLTKITGAKQYGAGFFGQEDLLDSCAAGVCLTFWEKMSPLEVVRLTTELHEAEKCAQRSCYARRHPRVLLRQEGEAGRGESSC